MPQAILKEWDESERGWGIRPDGASLHLSPQDCQRFIEAYWSTMPQEVPDEYSRPDGELKVVEVSDELYQRIKKTPYGLRLWQHDYFLLKYPNGWKDHEPNALKPRPITSQDQFPL